MGQRGCVCAATPRPQSLSRFEPPVYLGLPPARVVHPHLTTHVPRVCHTGRGGRVLPQAGPPAAAVPAVVACTWAVRAHGHDTTCSWVCRGRGRCLLGASTGRAACSTAAGPRVGDGSAHAQRPTCHGHQLTCHGHQLTCHGCPCVGRRASPCQAATTAVMSPTTSVASLLVGTATAHPRRRGCAVPVYTLRMCIFLWGWGDCLQRCVVVCVLLLLFLRPAAVRAVWYVLSSWQQPFIFACGAFDFESWCAGFAECCWPMTTVDAVERVMVCVNDCVCMYVCGWLDLNISVFRCAPLLAPHLEIRLQPSQGIIHTNSLVHCARSPAVS